MLSCRRENAPTSKGIEDPEGKVWALLPGTKSLFGWVSSDTSGANLDAKA